MKTKLTPKEIKSLREAMMMTQEEFADHIGAGKMSVWRWENGEAKPRLKHLRSMVQLWKQLFRACPA